MEAKAASITEKPQEPSNPQGSQAHAGSSAPACHDLRLAECPMTSCPFPRNVHEARRAPPPGDPRVDPNCGVHS